MEGSDFSGVWRDVTGLDVDVSRLLSSNAKSDHSRGRVLSGGFIPESGSLGLNFRTLWLGVNFLRFDWKRVGPAPSGRALDRHAFGNSCFKSVVGGGPREGLAVEVA